MTRRGSQRSLFDVEKPPYRQPTMAEAYAARGSNGLTVVSTFSGCGGSSLGFALAGYRGLYALEFVEAARDTYRANFPGVYVDERDVRDVKAEDILGLCGLKVGELDVLEGSPPCAAFSTAGAGSRKWGKESKYSATKQRTDDLFFEFARLLRGLKPRAFVAENVSGLVKGAAKGYFKAIFAELEDCGYKVDARLVDAQWLGVPQQRQRMIFVGVRNDVAASPAFPKPLPYRYSMKEALPNIVAVRKLGVGFGARDSEFDANASDAPAPTIMASTGNGLHEVEVASPSSDTDIEKYAIGDEWDRIGGAGTSEKYFSLVRPDVDQPCPTITATAGSVGAASVVHPNEKRKLTVDELRTLCSFPTDFVLTGSYSAQVERLGRAVPPLMMKAIASALADALLSAEK